MERMGEVEEEEVGERDERRGWEKREGMHKMGGGRQERGEGEREG